MILRSIELENFGRFRDQTVDFRRGMNLVIGPNESGKSTIAGAIPAVLFGTDQLERFKPWGRNACSAILFFEGQGRTIQVKRNLVTDEVELIEKDDLYHVLSQFSGKVPMRGRSASCQEYRALLESLLGVADESLFRATYFFGHQPLEWSGEELAKKLRTLVSGTAETDYAEILDSLLEEYFQLTRSNPWGRDKQRDREYQVVCQQLAALGETVSVPSFVEIDNVADIKEQVDKLSGELENDHQEFAKGLRYIERIRRQVAETSESAVSTVAERQTPAIEEVGSTGSLSEQLAAVGLPQNPPRELPQLLTEAAEIRQELATLQQPFSNLNNREKKIPAVPWVALGATMALLLAGGGIAWWLNPQAVWISLLCGVSISLLLGWGGIRYSGGKKALAECLEERSRLEQKRFLAQKRQTELSERCEALGLPSSAIDLVRMQKLVAVHRELLEKRWQQTEVFESESVDGQIESDRDDQKVAAKSNHSADENESERELRQLEVRMSEFEEGLKEKELLLRELQSQLNELSVNQVPQSTTSATVLLERKHEIEQRLAVLRKAINLLADAVDEFGRSHLTTLNNEASKLLNKITGGRYSAIRLDENMSPSVQVDGRRWIPAVNFSRGTVDAIYLALRIALAKVRDDGRSLPLMLDDPFVHLDSKRLATTLNLVDLASADGQLILFSHNSDLGKRAARERWHVVPLDGDSVAADPEEGGEHAGQLHLL